MRLGEKFSTLIPSPSDDLIIIFYLENYIAHISDTISPQSPLNATTKPLINRKYFTSKIKFHHEKKNFAGTQSCLKLLIEIIYP